MHHVGAVEDARRRAGNRLRFLARGGKVTSRGSRRQEQVASLGGCLAFVFLERVEGNAVGNDAHAIAG